jgi:chemotaxis signal transduction protein
MDPVEHRNVLESVDARTRIAGSDHMEILLFSLGTRETFGINVFEVRETMRTPPITRTPNVPRGVEGVVSLRGSIIPVISLARFVDTGGAGASNETMMVTEFNCHTQGFLVQSVDRIVQVEWNRMKAPKMSSPAATAWLPRSPIRRAANSCRSWTSRASSPSGLRVTGVGSPEGPLFRRVDAPRYTGMRPAKGAGPPTRWRGLTDIVTEGAHERRPHEHDED